MGSKERQLSYSIAIKIEVVKKVMHWVKTTMKMILVAVTMIFWVSMMNKLYYGR
jgi:hypothetical protein